MQTGALILVLLTLNSAQRGALAEGPPSTQEDLGEQILKKQEKCERFIGESINEILDLDEINIHDMPIPTNKYHECKDELDNMKREYMKTFSIDKSTNTDFFPIKIKDGSTVLVTTPAQEGAEIKHLEFDEVEELCVNSNICSEILREMEKETDREKKAYLEGRFSHCHILLDEIKQKYVVNKKLEEEKLKEEGGMTVTCAGKRLVMPLPQVINSLGYHSTPNGVFGEQLKDDAGYQSDGEAATAPTPLNKPNNSEEQGKKEEEKKEKEKEKVEEKEKDNKKEVEKKHDHHKEPQPEVKGTPSEASAYKANLVAGVLVVFVLVNIM